MQAGVVVEMQAVLVAVGQAHGEGVDALALFGRADDIVALAEAIGENGAAAGAGQLGHMGVLATHDDMAVLGDGAHELHERLLDSLKRAIVVEVVSLDVSDDDDVGVEVQERPVALVGLGDEVGALAGVAVRLVTIDDAANEERRLEVHALEHRGSQRRGRGLAMGAGAGNRDGVARQERQHLGAVPHLNTQFAGTHKLGVGLGDGRGDDHDIGLDLVDGAGMVAHEDLDSLLDQGAGVLRGLQVATGDMEATLVQHQRNAGHAGAADTDEMDALKGASVGFLSHDVRPSFVLPSCGKRYRQSALF